MKRIFPGIFTDTSRAQEPCVRGPRIEAVIMKFFHKFRSNHELLSVFCRIFCRCLCIGTITVCSCISEVFLCLRSERDSLVTR